MVSFPELFVGLPEGILAILVGSCPPASVWLVNGLKATSLLRCHVSGQRIKNMVIGKNAHVALEKKKNSQLLVILHVFLV